MRSRPSSIDSPSPPSLSAVCEVCTAPAEGKHFGAIACHACAAFFRRTVAFERSYTCRNHRKCQIAKVNPRQICRFCRMHRCLVVGMNIREVKAFHTKPLRLAHQIESTEQLAPGVLGDLLRARQTIFFNRVQYGMYKDSTVSKPATLRSMLRAMSAEAPVCLAYLRATRIGDHLGGDAHLVTLLRHFLPTWASMETFNSTVKNSGIAINRIYCINEEYIDLDLAFLNDFYGVEPSLANPQDLAFFEREQYGKMMEGAKIVAHHQLDDYEFAALVQMTLIHIAFEVLPERRPLLTPYLSRLFRELHRHHRNNYASPSVRMGTLVLLISEMQQLRRTYNERVLLLDLTSLWKTGPSAHCNGPYALEKFLSPTPSPASPVSDDEEARLWLPISVPLQLSLQACSSSSSSDVDLAEVQ